MKRIFRFVTGIASAIALSCMLAGSAAAGPYGIWTGSWTPGDNCRDPLERHMTARIGAYGMDVSIKHRQRGNGFFRAEFHPDGRFETRAIGPNQFGVQVRGRITHGLVTGTWTGRLGCTGSFTLYPPVI